MVKVGGVRVSFSVWVRFRDRFMFRISFRLGSGDRC